MEIPFVGQAYQTRSEIVSNQRCVNAYLELSPEGGRTRAALYGTPGLSLFSSLSSPATAIRVVNGRLFATYGGTFCEVSASGVLTTRGAIANTGFARLIDNGVQVLILTGYGAYVFDTDANTLTASTDPYLSLATQCTVIDGYGLFAEANSQRLRITEPYDFLTIDPTDVASAEGLPDNVSGVYSLNREAWIFGERSTEIWFNTGAANFPFERNSNTFIEFGLAAVNSVAKLDGALYWVGRGTDGRANIYRASGYQPEIIAHHGIAAILEAQDKAGGLAEAYAFAYRERGHAFYVVSLPTAERTIVYDPVSQAWHERSYLDPVLAREVHHLARYSVTFQGKTIVACRNNTLCEMSEDILTDLGQPIILTRSCPVIHGDQQTLSMSAFELLIQTGVGTSTGQGKDPTIQMRQSVDGGVSFGGWQNAPIGQIGDTARRVVWRRLGMAVNRVLEVRMSDPVKRAILGATVRMR